MSARTTPFHLFLDEKVEPKINHGQALGPRRTCYRTIGSGRAAQAVDAYRIACTEAAQAFVLKPPHRQSVI
jgi:hypothetical protein